MPVYESPGAGRVLIALADGPLVAEPTWTRYDNLADCRCYGFDVSRGRQSELDMTESGTARVFFHDKAQTLNDVDLVGLQIMLQLYNPVADEWQPCFRGTIDDIPAVINPGAPQLADTEIVCVDVFAYLAGVKMLLGTFGDTLPSGMSGVVFYEDGPVATGTNDPNDGGRIEHLLFDAGLATSMYVAFSGNVDLNETLYDPQDTVLVALRHAADAEFPGVANVYPDRFGRVAFHGREAKFDPVTVAAGASVGAWDFNDWVAATGEDVTSGVAQIREFAYNHPRDRIINVYTTWPREDENGVPIDMNSITPVSDSTSISAYGQRGEEKGDLIIQKHKTNGNTGMDECDLFEAYFVNNYKNPRKNIQRVTFKSLEADDARAAATWSLMTKCDISDRIELTVDEATIAAEKYFVEGIQLSCRPLRGGGIDLVEFTPNLSPAAYYTDDVFSA